MVKKAKTKSDKSVAKSAVKTKKAPVEAVVKPAEAVGASPSTVAMTPAAKRSEGFTMLRKLNLALALVLLAEAVLLALLGSNKTVPVTTQYLSVDSLGTVANGHQVLAMATRHIFDISLSILAAVGLVVFAVKHLAAATKLRARYEKQLTQDVTVSRWFSLALGGGILAVTVALMSGISQLAMLAALFLSVVVGCGLMPVVERLHQQWKGRLPHVVCGAATAIMLVPLLAIAVSVVGSLLFDGHISTGLWWVYAVAVVLYVSLYEVTHSRITRAKKWADAQYTERMYMFVIFVGVSALAWLTLVAVK